MRLPDLGDLFDGRYLVEETLGGGGMAIVYRATDIDSSRPVALKVLRTTGETYPPGTEARFEREVRIVANLRDSHTVTMFDFGRDASGLLYMVFEVVPGEDLSKILQRTGRLPPTTAVRIVRQVLSSLREAHTAGLLHRDIKPDNIRVHTNHDGQIEVKLLDFGIARRLGDTHAGITRTGELIGTPRYMSPEQLTDAELTPASDIYSLGVVAYEMLMGSEALQGNRWSDQFDRLASGHVFSFPEVEHIGVALAGVVAKMSARNPALRFRSADEVARALDQLDDDVGPGSPTSAPPPLDHQPPQPPRQRLAQTLDAIPLLLWGLFGLGLLAIAYIVGFMPSAPAPEHTNLPTHVPRPSIVRSEAADAASVPDVAVEDPDAAVMIQDVGGSIGCGSPPPFTGKGYLAVRTSIIAPSQQVLAHLPVDYDSTHPHPLVFLFHDDGFNPEQTLDGTKLAELADEHRFVVLAPAGQPAWFAGKAVDRGGLIAAVELASRSLCLDSERIFAIGQGGNGGGIAMELPCFMPGVAAIATASYQQEVAKPLCPEFRRVPYLGLHPNQDGNVMLEGGQGCSLITRVPLQEHEALLHEANECSEGSKRYGRYPNATCKHWDCEAPYVSCTLDGGRGWPGFPRRSLDLKHCDGTPANFPYGEAIWEFFQSAL